MMKTAHAKLTIQKTVKIKPEIALDLEDFAHKHRVTQTLVIEEALKAYFKEKEVRKWNTQGK
jgi:predicted transcriptional regulator